MRLELGGLHRVVDVATEIRKVLREPVAVLHQQVSLDGFHQVVEPGGHRLLLLERLRPDDVLLQGAEKEMRGIGLTMIREKYKRVKQLPEVVLIEQNQAKQRSRHGPLVLAVLEHNRIEDGGQNTLQDVTMKFHNFQEHITVRNIVAAEFLRLER